jgi:hypothetical protein
MSDPDNGEGHVSTYVTGLPPTAGCEAGFLGAVVARIIPVESRRKEIKVRNWINLIRRLSKVDNKQHLPEMEG